MRKPNVIVHLDVSPEESLKRIKSRSRDCESGIPLAYLESLHRGYEAFLDDISRFIPVIKVDWSEFQDAETMAKTIRQEWEAMRSVREVGFSGGKMVRLSRSDSASPNNAAEKTVTSVEETESDVAVEGHAQTEKHASQRSPLKAPPAESTVH
jgi:hypothetical protein